MRTVRALILPLLAVVLVASGCSGTHAVQTGPNGGFRFGNATVKGSLIPVGDRRAAADLTGPLLSGGTYSLTSDAGKVVLVNFWASWCPPCAAETPVLSTYYPSVRPDGVQFVGVNTKDLKDGAQAFVTDNKLTFPNLYDPKALVAQQLSLPVTGLPFTVLIDKHQRVAAVYVGEVLPADLAPVLSTLTHES